MVDLTTMVSCCAPLVREPLTAQQAIDLAREVFELTGPTISHHLKVLRESGLITGERRGTWIYYRVQPDALQAASELLAPAAGAVTPAT